MRAAALGPRCYLGARGEPELAQDVGDMAGSGGRADVELAGDGLIAEAAGDQADDLLFPRREPPGS